MTVHPVFTHSNHTTCCLSALLLCLGLCGSAGCSDDGNGATPRDIKPVDASNNLNNGGNNNTPGTTPGSNNTNTVVMMNNTTKTTNNTTPDNNNNGMTNNMDSPCENITVLPVISPAAGAPLALSADTTGATIKSTSTTSCGFGAAPEQGWQIEFDQPVRVSVNRTGATGESNWAIDVSRGECTAPQAVVCGIESEYTFAAPADTPYTLRVEPTGNVRGTVNLELQFEPLVCLPIGQQTCSGQDLEVCSNAGLALTQVECGAPCAGDACGGDACGGAIEVDALPYRFEATGAGYRNEITFDVENTCVSPDTIILPGGEDEEPPTANEPLGMLPTPGQDVIFLVKDLKQGQRLTVDASPEAGDEGDSAIFVLDSCDVMSCRIGLDIGDVLKDWVVPDDGDYFVVVDRISPKEATIAVDISVLPPE